jgi:hypothetical protein
LEKNGESALISPSSFISVCQMGTVIITKVVDLC